MTKSIILIIASFSIFFFETAYARTIEVQWDANSEQDLLGYRLYWGHSPGQLNRFQDVGRKTQFMLQELQPETIFYIGVTALDYWGNESAISNLVRVGAEDENGNPIVPEKINLSQNYPNPFNPGTYFNLELPERSFVDVAVYNSIGHKVRKILSATVDAGFHMLYWDGKDESGTPLPAGIYFCQCLTGEYNVIRQIALVR